MSETAAPDYASRATQYAEAVVAGLIPACKLTVSACRRHLGDLDRAAEQSEAFPYVYDHGEANRICGLVERFPHVKGSWASRQELIVLEDWQCFILGVSHGWLHRDTGLRRFRTVYIEVPRKNAKTTISVPVALDKIGPDGEQGAELVAAATKKDQAKIAFGIAQSMARKSEAFRTEFGVTVRANEIVCLETESVFKPIDAKGSTQDGANLHFSLNDELHAWKGRDLYAVLETAMGSREQPMMWNITTAGADQSGICYEQRAYLEKILKGILVDEQFFGIIYSIDPDDDIFDEAVWRKANPNYGVSVLPSDMQNLAHKARNSPKSRNDFRMKRLNVWVNAAAAYFDIDAWKACADPEFVRESNFKGTECRVGLDLASKRDINAALRLFKADDGRVALIPEFWLPQQALEDGDNASYAGWAEEGWITVTPGNVVDYDAIEERISGVDVATGETVDGYATLHDILELGFDPHQAYHLVQHLQDQDITCVEVRPTVLNFSEPMKELDRLIGLGPAALVHDGNPVMTWMMSNVVAIQDQKDNVYPRKERAENKIDGPVAAIMALARHLADENAAPTEIEYQPGQMFA